mgnify:FL=1
MEISGKVIQKLPLQEGTGRNGNPWKVQSAILETQEQYPRKICFEVFGEDRINNNPFEVDDVITISFDIDSHEFNGRWYTSIRAYRVQKGVVESAPAEAPAPAVAPMAAEAPAANTTPFDASASDESTDLPF